MLRFPFMVSLLLLPIFSIAQTTGTHGESIDEHGIIIEAPADAELRQYERNGMFLYYNEADGLTYTIEQSGTIDIALCDDGTIFFKDLVSATSYGSWVVGTRSGNDITIEPGQKLYWHEGLQATISLQCYDIGFEVKPSPTSIVFRATTQDNGRETLKLKDCDNWTHVVGTIWDDDQSVAQLGDYATELVFDPNNTNKELNEPVVLPANIEMKDYDVFCWSYRSNAYIHYTVKAGFEGDDMYIGGLYNFDAEMYLKGHREEGVVTFPRYQFMGNDGRGAPIYAVAVGYGEDEYGTAIFVDADQWTLTYNPEDRTYSGGDCCVRFARNPYYKYGNMYESIDEILLTPLFEEGITTVESDPVQEAPYFDLLGRPLNPANAHGLVIEYGNKKRLSY